MKNSWVDEWNKLDNGTKDVVEFIAVFAAMVGIPGAIVGLIFLGCWIGQ